MGPKHPQQVSMDIADEEQKLFDGAIGDTHEPKRAGAFQFVLFALVVIGMISIAIFPLPPMQGKGALFSHSGHRSFLAMEPGEVTAQANMFIIGKDAGCNCNKNANDSGACCSVSAAGAVAAHADDSGHSCISDSHSDAAKRFAEKESEAELLNARQGAEKANLEKVKPELEATRVNGHRLKGQQDECLSGVWSDGACMTHCPEYARPYSAGGCVVVADSESKEALQIAVHIHRLHFRALVLNTTGWKVSDVFTDAPLQSVTNITITDATFKEDLEPILPLLPPTLQAVNISVNTVSAAEFFTSNVDRFLPKGLQSLTLKFLNREFADQGLNALGDAIPQGLSFLSLSVNFASRFSSLAVMSFASRLPETLLHLSLEGRWGDDLGLIAISDRLLTRTKTLTSLSLFLCDIGEDGALAIGVHLPPSLTNLDLVFPGTEVGSKGAKAIGAHLPASLTSLHLNFSDTDVDSRGLKAIGAHLPASLISLSLDFYCTDVGTEGAEAIGAHLPASLTSLRFNFSDTDVGSEGAKAIGARLPSSLVYLDLDFSDSYVGEEGAKAIFAHLPSSLVSLVLMFEFELSHIFANAMGTYLPASLTSLDLSFDKSNCPMSFALVSGLCHDISDCSIC